MPSVLVYVAPEHLATPRGTGDRWPIRRGELVDPELVRPPDWTLYLATVRGDAVHVVGYLEDAAVDRDELGAATRCDVDVTPVIDRLGCATGAAGFAGWASTPVILTKNDADLLRYRLGLPLDMVVPPPAPAPPSRPPELPTGFEHDATALALLGAVYEDLTSDASRMVLADRLLELGDPRGEMIALQLARARSGVPATTRERELIALHGQTWAQPLTGCLTAYQFRRGFLAAAAVDDLAAMTPELYAHRAWSTVEELETRDPMLLVAPRLRSLRRVAISDGALGTLARHEAPLRIETIVGRQIPAPGGRVVTGGITVHTHAHRGDRGTIEALAASTALERVRALTLAIETPAQTRGAARLLATPFGRRLEHIELYRSRPDGLDVEPWRSYHARHQPLSLGLRTFALDWMVVIVRQRAGLFVQVGDPVSSMQPPSLAGLVGVAASLGYRHDHVTLEVINAGTADVTQVERELRRAFRHVEVAHRERWRSP